MLCMPPFPGRPSTPATPVMFEWVEGGIAAPSAHCGVANPIIGTTLRQRLEPRWRRGSVGLATDVPLWGVCIRQLGGLPAAVSSADETARGNPPSMRARALVRARSAVSCARYSACPGEDEEHQFVTYRLARSYVNSRGAVAIPRMKTRTTPISQTKTQALARVLASVTHGYTRVCMGTVPPERLSALVAKFDARYGIAHTKGQRVVNKRAGRANTQFVAYAPPDKYRVENERLPWMLLAAPGEGVEEERWQDVRDRPVWLDYQLCRHNDAGEVRWTWRRTSVEMTQLYAELGQDLIRQRYDTVTRTLERISNQPGFHGVRAQSMALFAFAISRGYKGALPPIFFVQKIAHGMPMATR